MRVSYKVGMVDGVRRVLISAPFALKDAIKRAGSRWDPKTKQWHAYPSSRVLRAIMASVEGALKGVSQEVGGEVEALLSQPASVADVVNRPLTNAVMAPRAYQQLGSNMIGQLSGCMLGWDMGSGKTKAVFDAILHYGMKRVLVVCPSKVIDSVWRRQAEVHLPGWFNYEMVLLGGDEAPSSVTRRAKSLEQTASRCEQLEQCLIAVVNPEAVWRTSMIQSLTALQWDLTVLDESHRMRNQGTKQAKAMIGKIGPASKRRVALSGTPLVNGPQDAFSQFKFLDPGVFGESVTKFRERWLVMGGFEGRQIIGHRDLPQFTAHMNEIASRVALRDVVELPPATHEVRSVTLGEEAKRIYIDLRNEFRAFVHEHGLVQAPNILVKLLRLAQVTSGHTVVESEDGTKRTVEVDRAKRDSLEEIVDAAPRGASIAVFCRFKHDLSAVHQVAAACERRSFEISGSASQQSEWEASCKAGEGPVIAVQMQSGSVGIDLTPASYGCMYSVGYDASEYEQALARLVRPGQTKPVIFYHLIAKGTVDALIYKAIREKKKIVDFVVEELTSGVEHSANVV